MEYVLKSLKNTLAVEKIANLHFFEFEKSFYTENDSHPFCELVFVSSGELHVKSEDYTGKLCRHQMILHRAGTSHSLTCTGDIAPTIIIIGFVCDAPMLEEFSYRPVSLREGSIKQLAEIVKEGRNVFAPPYDTPTYNMKKKQRQPFGAEQLLRILLEHFLITLVRERVSEHHDKEKFSSPHISAIREIITYVDDNYLEKITIDELAFLFNTNRATLCREFKTQTGMTLIDYINQKKLAYAKELIDDSQLTFTQISARLHFNSIHYFTRFFKSGTGMTPKQWRRREREAVSTTPPFEVFYD